MARSTFQSQNAKNTPCPDHFRKLRCLKSARGCGAKYISKSICAKHTRFGPLLEVEMSKKCTPLWREDARSTFRSQNVQSMTCSRHFWTFRCRFAWQVQGIMHLVKSEQNLRLLWHFQKPWQVWDLLKRICKDGFSVAGAVQVHQRC